MIKKLLHIYALLLLGTTLLAQDNVIRIKAPQTADHKPSCLFLLVEASGLTNAHGKHYWEDNALKSYLIDELVSGDISGLRLDLPHRDQCRDINRGEFASAGQQLGALLGQYHAELIDDLPVKHIPLARKLRDTMEKLANESGAEWVPYMPGVTEYLFTNGFISGIKLNLYHFQREVSKKNQEEFFAKMSGVFNRLELDLTGIQDQYHLNRLRSLASLKSFKKIKEVELLSVISDAHLRRIIQNPGFNHLEKFDVANSLTINQLVFITRNFPNLKSINGKYFGLLLISRASFNAAETPYLIRETEFLNRIYQGKDSLFDWVTHTFPVEEERAKLLEKLFTEARFQRKIGLRNFTKVCGLYNSVPMGRQDLKNQLVAFYLERYPSPLKLASDVKERLKNGTLDYHHFAKHLMEKASDKEQVMLMYLKKLTENEITESQYRYRYQVEQNKISHFHKWKDHFKQKERLNLLEGLLPESFETVLFEVPEGGLKVQLGSFYNQKESLTFDLPVKRRIKKSFRIRKTPVTMGQYQAYLADTGHKLRRSYQKDILNLPVHFTKSEAFA